MEQGKRKHDHGGGEPARKQAPPVSISSHGLYPASAPLPASSDASYLPAAAWQVPSPQYPQEAMPLHQHQQMPLQQQPPPPQTQAAAQAQAMAPTPTQAQAPREHAPHAPPQTQPHAHSKQEPHQQQQQPQVHVSQTGAQASQATTPPPAADAHAPKPQALAQEPQPPHQLPPSQPHLQHPHAHAHAHAHAQPQEPLPPPPGMADKSEGAPHPVTLPAEASSTVYTVGGIAGSSGAHEARGGVPVPLWNSALNMGPVMMSTAVKAQSMPRTPEAWTAYLQANTEGSGERNKSHTLQDAQWPDEWLGINKVHLKKIENDFNMPPAVMNELLQARRRHQNRLAARRSRQRKNHKLRGAETRLHGVEALYGSVASPLNADTTTDIVNRLAAVEALVKLQHEQTMTGIQPHLMPHRVEVNGVSLVYLAPHQAVARNTAMTAAATAAREIDDSDNDDGVVAGGGAGEGDDGEGEGGGEAATVSQAGEAAGTVTASAAATAPAPAAPSAPFTVDPAAADRQQHHQQQQQREGGDGAAMGSAERLNDDAASHADDSGAGAKNVRRAAGGARSTRSAPRP